MPGDISRAGSVRPSESGRIFSVRDGTDFVPLFNSYGYQNHSNYLPASKLDKRDKSIITCRLP